MTRIMPALALLASIACLFASFDRAEATTTTTDASLSAKSSDEKVAEIKSIVQGRLRIGLSINTATKLDGLNYRQGDTSLATGSANTDTTQALDLAWVSRLYEGPEATKFDWFAGLTLERERPISTVDLKVINSTQSSQTFTLDPNSRPGFHASLVSVGLRWTPNALIYVPIGINYGFRTDSFGGGSDTFDLESRIGFQAGAGLHLAQNFELETIYKIVRYNLTYHATDSKTTGVTIGGPVDLAGLTIGARYIF